MVTGGADLTPDGEFSPLCPSSENESYEHFPQGIMVGTLLVCYRKQSHCTFISPSYFYQVFVCLFPLCFSYENESYEHFPQR